MKEIEDLIGLNVQDLMALVCDKYNIVELRDCYDGEAVNTIMLNKKHSIEDFQDAINKAKEKHEDDIQKYGDDWSWIEEELDDFDYMIFGFNDADYWVEY
jgi:hypothetical protein